MENLLAWAKQQMSGMQASKKEVKVKQIVEEIMESHRFNARHKGIKLNNELPESLKATGDYDMLKLVMRNLISNSIKFSNTGDTITVSGSRKQDFVLLSVKDTGIGIPEDMQDKIFEEDLSSRRGTSEEKGSGLGLRLCKEFIEIQGGSISFDSKEGKGTTFWIRLPAAELAQSQRNTANGKHSKAIKEGRARDA
jgi:signal transduction histidine kinase